MKRKVLVVDIGGTHVKLLMSLRDKREFESGPAMTPRDFVGKMKETTGGWKFDAISIGFPSVVLEGRIVKDPKNLGPGWAGLNLKAVGKPVPSINGAAMQGLGSYHGRRMLFLGLGTGLGSALVWKQNLLPLELGDLPYRDRQIIEEWLGIPGLQRLGEIEWKEEVLYAVGQLKRSFIADYVVLGGGNAKRFQKLPEGIEPGGKEKKESGGGWCWGGGGE